jgi:hypothetical protein
LRVLRLACVIAALAGTLSSRARALTPASPGEFTPEAERTLGRVVLGLDPNQTKLFMMPETAVWDPKARDSRVRWLRRQLYRLNFELIHGQIFRHWPRQSRFFISVPDPRTTPESLGNEEELFREHLKERVGWTDRQIDERVRFFKIPEPVPYPQDMTEPIGYDSKGRLVLALGDDVDAVYREAAQRLAAAFPEDFVIRPVVDVNTEGGDLALVRLPEGNVGLLIGHNRVARWVRRRYPGTPEGAPLPKTRIEEARRAYQTAFGGVETIVIGPEALTDPRLDNPEIYHIDMLVAVLRTPTGIVAFVPTYEGTPVDAVSNDQLSPQAVSRFQGEFDRTARQLAQRGYRVARVPFADHPARNPVGIAKFIDPNSGKPWVILGRYPDHLPGPGKRSPHADLQRTLERLDEAVAAWRTDPSEARWQGVRSAVAASWKEFDASVAAPNPIFERQRKIYESYGVGVAPLPIFPTGEGGVHCLVLK